MCTEGVHALCVQGNVSVSVRDNVCVAEAMCVCVHGGIRLGDAADRAETELRVCVHAGVSVWLCTGMRVAGCTYVFM